MTTMKKKTEKTKSTLSSAQEVTYLKEFKRADRASGMQNRNNY
ncbi:YfhE family protein [Metabacillus arenae]|uniref:YfhE family protein n=1 Tax=Metabacillus arenae TaxID=2771434 RepID=A0A926NKB9_9BACI|nr:YfhE family protein [Metabacillus arenae]MBD1379647.1 YfhE family protein [Metabacillus arenae]